MWLGLLASLACIVAFRMLEPVSGGLFLDSLSDPDAARRVIAGLDPGQRRSHVFASLVVDSAFPFAYALVFASTVRRCWGPGARLPAYALLVVIAIDLAENAIQALALAGGADLLAAKTVLTPAKFALFALGAAAALGGLAWALLRRFFRSR